MSILVDKDTRVLVQGITGNEGTRATEWMLAYGTRVVAGVTPGKGGQEVHGVPVYNSIKEAKEKHKIDASAIYVPPAFCKGAIFEAIEAKVPLINIISEGVPVKDVAQSVWKARQEKVRLVGPSSIGIISPGKAKIGSIGGGEPDKVFRPGKVGVISKSGGMSSEISQVLSQAGLGQSTVIGIGGDIIVGSTYADLLALFEKDGQTRAVVIFGEPGGTYEEEAAEALKDGRFTKPLIAFIVGEFSEMLPQGVAIGHSGAIIEGERGTPRGKKEALRKAGARVAETLDEIPGLVKKALNKQINK